ncbi:MAG TPA: S8 family serine peptidase [Steroidobacteraceae bacterium]|nr:S8 family serine peptidase [Steroidobacteraceae bacterium]
MRARAFIFAGLITLSASAQLPQVQLPQIPQLPGGVLPEVTRGIGGTLREITGARALRAERLLNEHRAQLDRDPRGDLVVRAEVIAIDVTDAALANARKARFNVLRTREMAELGVKITVLQTPEGWSATRGLKRLRKLDPDGTYEYNHIYLDVGEVGAATTTNASANPAPPGGAVRNRVGLIDGGVEATHIALRAGVVHQFGCDGNPVPSVHGTAVASLIAGSTTDFQGAAPHAELFAADVYCGLPTGGAVEAVAAALGWMAKERVAVINVSLVGPRNALLERAVKVLNGRGHLIVAAVGNDGPAAPPLYPAAYADVIGVTAVDDKHRVLLEACRGRHLALAAPGADLRAADATDATGYKEVRGTSFAAPLVAGLLARALAEPDPVAGANALAALTSQALDLGPRGRDDIYGAGLVAANLPEDAEGTQKGTNK